MSMTDTRSAGRIFIDKKLAEHPNVKGVLDVLSGILDFFFGGHVFVWIVNKLVMTAGRIAESILMLGTLWITSELVVGKELNAWIATWPLPASSNIPANITTLCIMAFSLIPEIILLSSIVSTFRRWWVACHQKGWLSRIGWGTWSVLYTLPTIAFIVLVYITFQKLTSVQNIDDVVQAGTDTIQARVLAGWFYSIVEMLFPLIMRTIQELNAGIHESPVSLSTSETERPIESPNVDKQTLSISGNEGQVENPIEKAVLAAVEKMKAENESLVHLSMSKIEDQIESLTLQNKQDIESQIESLSQAFNESLMTLRRTVSVTLEQTESQTIQAALKPAKRVSTQIAQKSEMLSFDRKQFVYDCLQSDANMSIADMQLKAKNENKKLSIGIISNYRKAFFEEYPDLSVAEIESQIESPESDFEEETESLEMDRNSLSMSETESHIEEPNSDQLPVVVLDFAE